jgi:hypothetical protein
MIVDCFKCEDCMYIEFSFCRPKIHHRLPIQTAVFEVYTALPRKNLMLDVFSHDHTVATAQVDVVNTRFVASH